MAQSIDFAAARNIDAWLHHPVCGDPSFDAFERLPINPLVTGEHPYEWTVNGSLFSDPVNPSDLYCYVALYPHGYWPCGGCRCLRSSDEGRTWEDLGVIIDGPPQTFAGVDPEDRATPDVHVVYAEGRYHMAYDWANRANDHGGIAYASAPHPAGPWEQHSEPIHLDVTQQPIGLGYVRTYGASIHYRPDVSPDRRWLVLTAMSLPGNSGGTWALAALTASSPTEQWTEPRLVILPQSDRYHPAPVEFFPTFTHEDWVYVPATSVATNRSYQILYRAPLARAEDSDAWEVVQAGSIWHDEPAPHEHFGIWGQTISCSVRGGKLFAMFPSKNASDVGTISLAVRPWETPNSDGFVLSAPESPSLGVLQRSYDEFTLDASIDASEGYGLLWGHTAAIGPERLVGAHCGAHPSCFGKCYRLSIELDRWSVAGVDADGTVHEIASGSLGEARSRGVVIRQSSTDATVRIDGREVWTGLLPVQRGRLGIVADPGCVVKVGSFRVDREGERPYIPLLPTEATMGWSGPPNDWHLVDTSNDNGGVHCRSEVMGAGAKYSWHGKGFRLNLPRGADTGAVGIFVDGSTERIVEIPGTDGFETIAMDLEPGYHAVVLRVERPPVVLGGFEYLPL